jgi:hypothetical protein
MEMANLKTNHFVVDLMEMNLKTKNFVVEFMETITKLTILLLASWK